MLDVEVNDKLIRITDDDLTKAKIDSIKTIVDKYGIREVLDFKLSFKQTYFKIAEEYTDSVLSESIDLERLYDILTDMFDAIDEEEEYDTEDLTISFEGLFII